MSTLEILFDVPETIKSGLASGIYKLYDTGVVRNISNGQIVMHLKQIIPFQSSNGIINIAGYLENPFNILQGIQLSQINNKLDVIQNMQKLQLAGIAGIGLICVAGFIYLGIQNKKIMTQLSNIQQSLNHIKEDLELLHIENLINITKNYYRAEAAFKECEYEKGLHLARECSADILAYIKNIPSKILLHNEAAMRFLLQTLSSTMQCQLACAYKLNVENIPEILQRYRELFEEINDIVNSAISKSKFGVPDTHNMRILQLMRNKDSQLYALTKALPVAIEFLEDEKRFIELVPTIEPEMLEEKIKCGAKYIALKEE